MHAHVDPPDLSRMHAYTPGMARPRLYRLVQSILEHMHIGNWDTCISLLTVDKAWSIRKFQSVIFFKWPKGATTARTNGCMMSVYRWYQDMFAWIKNVLTVDERWTVNLQFYMCIIYVGLFVAVYAVPSCAMNKWRWRWWWRRYISALRLLCSDFS